MVTGVKRKSFSHTRLFATPILESIEFSQPDYWHGQPFPSPGDLPSRGIEPRSPALQADSLPPELSGKPKAVPNLGLNPGAQGLNPEIKSLVVYQLS